jgi:hypothetical protein
VTNSALTRWLHQGLAKGLCPLCHVGHKAEKEYLWYFFDQYSGQDAALDELRAAHGFCLRHAAGLRRIEVDNLKSTLGISETYEDTLDGIAEQLVRLQPGRPFEHRACPACVKRDDEVRRNARHLVAMLTDSERERERYGQSPGLCMEHFALVWEVAGDGMAAALIAEVQRRSIDTIREQLAEHIRKQGAEAQGEAPGVEADAWQRALLITGGWPDEDLDP